VLSALLIAAIEQAAEEASAITDLPVSEEPDKVFNFRRTWV
jgi:hypothetical protein